MSFFLCLGLFPWYRAVEVELLEQSLWKFRLLDKHLVVFLCFCPSLGGSEFGNRKSWFQWRLIFVVLCAEIMFTLDWMLHVNSCNNLLQHKGFPHSLIWFLYRVKCIFWATPYCCYLMLGDTRSLSFKCTQTFICKFCRQVEVCFVANWILACCSLN